MKKSYILLAIALLIALIIPILINDWGNNITGTNIVNTKVNIISVSGSDCNFTMHNEWNLVSFYCLGMLNTRDSVLSNISGKYEKIFTYDAFDQSDPWKSYNPSLPPWAVQQLGYMDRLSGYYIYMNQTANFYFAGYKKYSIITLKPGWNLIGYPRLVTAPVNDSFIGIKYTMIKGYDAAAQRYIFYVPNSSGSSLNETRTYQAYWINSTASQSLTLQVG